VLLVGVCEHLCMCYVSFTFLFSCFSGYCLSDAIVNSLAFHRSVVTPPTPSILHPYHVSTLLHHQHTHSMHIDALGVGRKAKDCDLL